MSPQRWTEDVLARWAAPARGEGIRVRTLIRAGVPHREIVAAARDEAVDLIIMGAHGRGGLERFLVGSVADRVIRTASCPVLLCSERDAEPA